ncbi:MAG TPA: glycosyltransferase family 39 protein [Aggregatilineaceae bacterium]|nr:glycosyltransferase family 39 protein [Aggregatilineaceae bacterium]
MSKRLVLISSTMIMLLVFALMIHNLTRLVLWADEAWTVEASGGSVHDAIERVGEDVHPPLFFMELNMWRRITGDSIFAMRYLAVLLTVISTALVIRLGHDLFGGLTGLIAGLLYALNDMIAVFGQEVRHYAQQQVLCVLVIWLYWRLWQRPSRGRAAVFSIAGAALLLSNYWGGFVLLALGVHAILTQRRQIRMWLLTFAGIGILYIPWLPMLYKQITEERPNGLPRALDNSWPVFKQLMLNVVGAPEILWVLLLAAGVVGVRRLWKPTAASVLPALIIGMTLGGSVLANAVYASLSTRSVAVMIPAVVVLAANALAQFRRPEQVIVVGFLVWYGATTAAADPPGRADWPDVADYLAAHSGPDDLILLELNNRELMDWEENVLAYYLDHEPEHLRYLPTEGARVDDPAGFGAYLERNLQDEPSVWIVKLGWPYYDLRADVQRLGFDESAPVAAWEPFTGLPIEVYRFDRPPSGEPVAAFGDVMRLADASMTSRDQQVTVNLVWWPADVPTWNYTVSTFALNESGALVKQHDSYPMNNQSPTLNWQADQVYYDSHVLGDLPPGQYQVGIKVYYFTDPGFQQLEIVPVAGCEQNCDYWLLGTVEISDSELTR